MSILNTISQIADTRALPQNLVLDVIKESIASVIKANLSGREVEVEVNISEAEGTIKAFVIEKGKKEEYPFEKFGRNAIIKARELLQQKIKEREKEKVKEKYVQKVDEIITGTVQKADKNEIIVKLDNAEGVLPSREQIPGEHYNQGDIIKAYILTVTPAGNILLSRTHPNFLKKLFIQEVPELQEGIIEIKNVARIPGVRAKITVSSSNTRIDPVGACVGVKGSRIQMVVKELNNEKIDVIQFSPDLIVLVSRALSGVNIVRNDVNWSEKRMTIIVKDVELPKAIGKNGQNVLLAAKLTGYKIDILSEAEYKNKGVVFINEFPDQIKEILITHSFTTTTEIVNKGVTELLKIPGIDEEQAENIYNIAKRSLGLDQLKAPQEQARLILAETGTPDTGSPDTGAPKTGSSEANSPEASSPAAASPETGTPETGSPETPQGETPGTGSPETGSPEASSSEK